MPVSVDVKVSRHGKRLTTIARGIDRRTTKLGEDVVKDIVREAQANAPVLSGHLKASIKHRKVGEGHFTARVGAYYGVYVEYGHRKADNSGWVPAQPFWTPAVDLVKATTLKKGMKGLVRK